LGQVLSSGLLSLSHGTNDGQKTMGVITLALVAEGSIPADHVQVPTWVIIASASALAFGTYAGGWRIIKTTGMRIIKMDPSQGFAAQSAGAAAILAASHYGFPISTTHVINGGVMGAGAAKRLSAVRWGVAGNTVAFSTVIYCVDRASELRRDRRGGAAAMTLAGMLALALCLGLVVYGVILVTSKGK